MEDFNTHEQAQTAVFAYMEVFYNRQRCHAAHGYLAPRLYEQTLKTDESLCPEEC
jgi:putative transposase